MAYLESFLNQIAEKTGVEVDTAFLTAMVYGTIYLEDDDPNAHYILYDRNHIFTSQLKNQYPLLYKDFYGCIVEVRKMMDLPLDDAKINLLIFTLYVNWDNLIIDLHKKYQHISILVISDGHFSHGKMIERFLNFELRNNVTFDTYHHRNLTPERLNRMDSDLIISTFKLPEFIDKPCIIVEHYPSQVDILRIESLIDELLEQKYTGLKSQYTN